MELQFEACTDFEIECKLRDRDQMLTLLSDIVWAPVVYTTEPTDTDLEKSYKAKMKAGSPPVVPETPDELEYGLHTKIRTEPGVTVEVVDALSIDHLVQITS